MPRVRKVFTKRVFRGNRHSNSRSVLSSSLPEKDTNVDVNKSEVRSNSSKLKQLYVLDEKGYEMFEDSDSCNVIVDLSLLSNLIQSFAACKHCTSSNTVCIKEESTKRKGLATNISVYCSNCNENLSTMTSKIGKHRLYEINTRFVYGIRCIGKGQSAGKTLCAVMNLPPPPTTFKKHSDVILNATAFVSDISMMKAANEAVRENSGSINITAAFDGTWQKRGHTSLNGVVTVTSFETGKVLDVECLTKYCQGCTLNKMFEGKHEEQCVTNYSGSSGGMEVIGVEKLFQRSFEKTGVRYVKYLGDGDSKAFDNISNKKPYGNDVQIEKLECIGHVQKRVGARLRRLKNQHKKLSDGKTLSGRGRLTDSEIDLIQTYYGLAIRRNTGDSEKMKRAIWAIYFHKLSTDDSPQHGLCPTDAGTWCGYNKALLTNETYSHKHSLPKSVMEAIKPIFRDLSDDRLLQKCTHGKTQNPNESLNHVIWSRIPKDVFVGLRTLKLGVFDAALTFNEGAFARAIVLKELSIDPGKNTVSALRKIDELRMKKAEREAEMMTKEARTHRRNEKRKMEENENESEVLYCAGGF